MILNGIIIPKGSLVTIGFNGLVFLYCCAYIVRCTSLWKKFGFLYLYLIFLFVMALLTSSDFFHSLRMWMKYSISIMCLSIGFDIFDNDESIHRLWNALKIFFFLFVANFTVANIYHLGGSRYGTEAMGAETGNLFDEALYTNIAVIIIMPYMLHKYKQQNTLVLIMLTALISIITILLMKRTVIICLFVAILCFPILWQYLKMRYGKLTIYFPTRLILLGLVFICCFLFVFQDSIGQQYNARTKRFDMGLKQEGRTQELEIISKDIMSNKDFKTFLLGQETFNTVGTYAKGKFGNRMIHENYGIFLNGTGIIGTIIYIYIHMYLLFIFFRYIKNVNFNDISAYLLYIAYLSLWLTFVLASFSGTVWLIFYPSIHYMISGMILRYFYERGQIDNALYRKTENRY